MANKASKKVTVIRERFDAAMKLRKTSIRKLGTSPVIDRTEKTLRRSLKTGFNPEILDRIGRVLDVDPHFLQGAYDWPLNEKDLDPQIKKLYREERLRPENFPYRFQLQRKPDYRETLKAVLALHGIPADDLSRLKPNQRMQLDDELDRKIYQTLHKYFPQTIRANQYYNYGEEEASRYDIIDMFADQFPYTGGDRN